MVESLLGYIVELVVSALFRLQCSELMIIGYFCSQVEGCVES